MDLVGMVRKLETGELNSITLVEDHSQDILSDIQNLPPQPRFDAELVEEQGTIELIINNYPYYMDTAAVYGHYSLTLKGEKDSHLLIKDGVSRAQIPFKIENWDGFFKESDTYQLFFNGRKSLLQFVPSVINTTQHKILEFYLEEQVIEQEEQEEVRKTISNPTKRYKFQEVNFTKKDYTSREASELLLQVDGIYTEAYISNRIYTMKLLNKIKEGNKVKVSREDLEWFIKRPIPKNDDGEVLYEKNEIMARLDITEEQLNSHIRRKEKQLKVDEDGLIGGRSAVKVYDKLFPPPTGKSVKTVSKQPTAVNKDGYTLPPKKKTTLQQARAIVKNETGYAWGDHESFYNCLVHTLHIRPSGDKKYSTIPTPRLNVIIEYARSEMERTNQNVNLTPTNEAQYMKLSRSSLGSQEKGEYKLIEGPQQDEDSAHIRSVKNGTRVHKLDVERYDHAKSYLTETAINKALSIIGTLSDIIEMKDTKFDPQEKGIDVLTLNGEKKYHPDIVQALFEHAGEELISMSEMKKIIRTELGTYNLPLFNSAVRNGEIHRIMIQNEAQPPFLMSEIKAYCRKHK